MEFVLQRSSNLCQFSHPSASLMEYPCVLGHLSASSEPCGAANPVALRKVPVNRWALSPNSSLPIARVVRFGWLLFRSRDSQMGRCRISIFLHRCATIYEEKRSPAPPRLHAGSVGGTRMGRHCSAGAQQDWPPLVRFEKPYGNSAQMITH